MTSASGFRGQSQTRTITTLILAVIAVVAIVVGVIYFVEPAKSLPSVLGVITHPASRANAHRTLRGAAAIAIGVACLAAAWYARRPGRSAAN